MNGPLVCLVVELVKLVTPSKSGFRIFKDVSRPSGCKTPFPARLLKWEKEVLQPDGLEKNTKYLKPNLAGVTNLTSSTTKKRSPTVYITLQCATAHACDFNL